MKGQGDEDSPSTPGSQNDTLTSCCSLEEKCHHLLALGFCSSLAVCHRPLPEMGYQTKCITVWASTIIHIYTHNISNVWVLNRILLGQLVYSGTKCINQCTEYSNLVWRECKKLVSDLSALINGPRWSHLSLYGEGLCLERLQRQILGLLVKTGCGRNSHLSNNLDLPCYSVRSQVTIWVSL